MALFPTTLRRLLKTAGVTQVEFAKRIGVPPGLVNDLLTGRRKPPAAKMAAFAEGLGLRGQSREQFLDVAALAHCPERIQRLIAKRLPDFPEG